MKLVFPFINTSFSHILLLENNGNKILKTIKECLSKTVLLKAVTETLPFEI